MRERASNSEKSTKREDPRIRKVKSYIDRTYSVSDKTTPEGQALTDIGKKLEHTLSDTDIKYRIINIKGVNTFTLGDTVYLSAGLLSKLDTESQVAAVLADNIREIEKEHEEPNLEEEKKLDTFSDVLELISKPRIHQQEKDSSVFRMLDKAGYNPTAWSAALEILDSETPIARNTRERRVAQTGYLRVHDYESTSERDIVEGPAVLKKDYLQTHYEPFLFDKISPELQQCGQIELQEAMIEQLYARDPELLFDLQEYIENKVLHLESERKFDHNPSRHYGQEIKNFHTTMNAIDHVFEKKIRDGDETLSDQEISWRKVMLYTEVAGRGLPSPIFQPQSWLATKINEEIVLPLVEDRDALLALAQFTSSSERSWIQDLGYELPDSGFPGKIFKWSLLHDFAEHEAKSLSNIENFENALQFSKQLGIAFGEGEDAAKATVTVMRIIADEAIKTRRFGIVDVGRKLLRYAEPFWAPDVIDEEREQALQYITRENRAAKNELLRDSDLTMNAFRVCMEGNRIESFIPFIQKYGMEKFAQYATINEVSWQTNKKELDGVKEFIWERYTPTSQDKNFLLKNILSSDLSTPQVAAMKERYTDAEIDEATEQLLEEAGLDDYTTKTLFAIQLFESLISGNELPHGVKLGKEKQTKEFKKVIDSIDVDQLSSEASGMVLGALFKAGGYLLRERERGVEFYYITEEENVVALRDKFINAWQDDGVSLAQRVAQVDLLQNKLSWLRSPSKDREWATVISEVESQTFGKESIDELKMLHTLVGSFHDERFAAKLRSSLELQIVQKMSFDDATEYLKGLLDKDKLPFRAFEWYQDKLMQTPEELEKAEVLLDEYFSRVQKEGNEAIGKAVGIDALWTSAEYALQFTATETFQAGLDDAHLRKLLAKAWYKRYFERDVEGEQVTVQVNRYLSQPPPSFESWVKKFYETISQTEVDFLLRRTLLAKDSPLTSEQGRKKVRDSLLDLVEENEENASVKQLIGDIMDAGLEKVDPVRLYQPLANILNKRMFVEPEEPGSNDLAIMGIQEMVLAEARQKFTSHQNKKPEWEAIEALLKKDFAQSTAVLDLSTAKKHLKEQILDDEVVRVHEEKKEPITVLLDFARSLSAPGVRFAQTLQQYVPISEKNQEQAGEVYDQERGQLKITAYKTLRREATKEHALPALKEFWNNLDSLGPIEGGGSLMVGCRATMKDGGEYFVKILNPNAESFIRETTADGRAVVDKMHANNTLDNAPLIKLLVDDVESWLLEDISAVDYEQDEKDFAAINHNVVVDTSAGPITIGVPKMIPTGSKYIKIEEFVPGDNLTTIINKEGAAAAKPFVEAAGKSFDRQLSTPTESGEYKVHTDPHPGNLRRGTDGKLYWLDRGYYITLNPEETSVVNPLLTGEVTPENSMNALNYLLSLPENDGKSVDFDKLISDADLFASTPLGEGNENKSRISQVNGIMHGLKQQGIAIPLRFTLLLKDFNARLTMEEQVGIH